MHSRRPAAIPSLSLVLPHPPLPRRSSTPRSSLSSPRTPSQRSLKSPSIFKTESSAPRTSTDSWTSWNSSNYDDDLEWEWTSEQVNLLTKTLDAVPSHLMTPFNGAVPPSNLLDKISRSIIQGKDSLEWPHSVRATRLKLIELAKMGQKRSALCEERPAADSPANEVLRTSTNVPSRRLYRQSSMDFIADGSLRDEKSSDRLSARLQRADRIISSPVFHPYNRPSRPSSPDKQPPPPLAADPLATATRTPLKSMSSVNSVASRSAPRLRRAATGLTPSPLVPIQAGAVLPPQPLGIQNGARAMQRSESFSYSADRAQGRPLKRAPSYGVQTVAPKASEVKATVTRRRAASPDVSCPSSDEEEKARTKKSKKPRTRSITPSREGSNDDTLRGKASKKASASGSGSSTGSTTPKNSLRDTPTKKSTKPKRPTVTEIFGGDLAAPVQPSASISSPCEQPTAPPTPLQAAAIISPSPTRTLRRVKVTQFPPRRISFSTLEPPIEELEGSGAGLGSAFKLH